MDQLSQAQVSADIKEIITILANILTRGLSGEQRDIVLQGTSITVDMKKLNTALGFYRALLADYNKSRSLNSITSIAHKVQGFRSFVQDIGSDIEKLLYLIKKHEGKGQEYHHVFVLLPFNKDSFKRYNDVIKPVIEEFDCIVGHAEELIAVGDIVNAIFSQIMNSKFLVADTTGKNPNVFYELGYAHGLGKKVILLAQNENDIPFNVKGQRYIIYDPENIEQLRVKLRKVASILMKEGNDTPIVDMNINSDRILLDDTNKKNKKSQEREDVETLNVKEIANTVSNQNINRITELLLACASIIDKDVRDSIVNQLPKNMIFKIARYSHPKTDVQNLVKRCLEFESGFESLLESVRFFEGDTIQYKQLEKFAISLRLSTSSDL